MWWMEGNNNNNKLHLRPLMPRQPIADRMLPWNHHHHHHPMAAAAGEYGLKREVGPHTLVSTRWNPTPEQLQGLEELYRRGTRTPSAEQIQHIASRLRRFGKIEGKNVFYWFQNHKARERQKKRRQLIQHHQPPPGILSKRSYLDHKKLATNTPPQEEEEEESASMHGSVIAERNKKLDVWTHTNTNCVQQQQQQQDADHEIITSWKLDLSLFDKPATPPPPPPGQQNADPTTEIKLNRTLQLFPIRTTVDSNGLANRDDNVSGNESDLLHNQFIEFLPTKKYNCG